MLCFSHRRLHKRCMTPMVLRCHWLRLFVHFLRSHSAVMTSLPRWAHSRRPGRLWYAEVFCQIVDFHVSTMLSWKVSMRRYIREWLCLADRFVVCLPLCRTYSCWGSILQFWAASVSDIVLAEEASNNSGQRPYPILFFLHIVFVAQYCTKQSQTARWLIYLSLIHVFLVRQPERVLPGS